MHQLQGELEALRSHRAQEATPAEAQEDLLRLRDLELPVSAALCHRGTGPPQHLSFTVAWGHLAG